ncbi:MAG TPA: phosphatase PAP2 family protein [Gaiellaceae bacterium]|nr:phosphatase PAP2 family protein [Gaiellaceae bacterium]
MRPCGTATVSPGPPLVAVAAAAAFGALAGVVASGAATGIDQWACQHVMPFAGAPGQPPTLLESVVPLLHASFHPAGAAVAEIVTLPGQVVVSFLLVLTAAGALRRRGRRAAAVVWPAAWVVAVAVEVVFRHWLTRPPLHRHGVHLVAFDSSWPSGHALRSTIAAVALVAAWPKLRPLLAIWLAAAVVLLELAGFHTPTDIAGGLLLATVAAVGAGEVERSGLLGSRAALRRPRSRSRG